MKKSLLFLSLFVFASVYAEDVIYYPEYEDSVSFYASFDTETTVADICDGYKKPRSTAGKVQFADGVRGKALVCGANGAGLRYERKDNINFTRPGTLLFFFKGIDWETNKGLRIFFTGIEAGNGFLGFQTPARPIDVCPCNRFLNIAFMYNKKVPDKTFLAKMPGGTAECGKWHMIAFSWTHDQLRVNMDNLPGTVFRLDFTFNDELFKYGLFSVGHHLNRKYLLDEYTVYNRRLNDGELADIFNKYTKNIK